MISITCIDIASLMVSRRLWWHIQQVSQTLVTRTDIHHATYKPIQIVSPAAITKGDLHVPATSALSDPPGIPRSNTRPVQERDRTDLRVHASVSR